MTCSPNLTTAKIMKRAHSGRSDQGGRVGKAKIQLRTGEHSVNSRSRKFGAQTYCNSRGSSLRNVKCAAIVPRSGPSHSRNWYPVGQVERKTHTSPRALNEWSGRQLSDLLAKSANCNNNETCPFYLHATRSCATAYTSSNLLNALHSKCPNIFTKN